MDKEQQLKFACLLPQMNKIFHSWFHKHEEVASDFQVRQVHSSEGTPQNLLHYRSTWY